MNTATLIVRLRELLAALDDPAHIATVLVAIAEIEATRLDTPHPEVHTAHHDDDT